MDVIHDLACPLPVRVIAEMLGVRPTDREHFQRWSDEISVVVGGDVASLPEAALRRALEARGELVDYFCAAVTRGRLAPGDDLLTALVRAEEGGGRLTEDDLYSTAVLLLVAGNETTTNLIGNGLLALLRQPDQIRQVWGDEELVAPAVEEMLRYDSPVQLTTRLARVDLDVLGTTIGGGQWVYLILAAANRDPGSSRTPTVLTWPGR